MDISSYVLSKRYTDDNVAETKQYVEDTVIGGGAIKGAPCEIQSIEEVDGGNKITFTWKLEDGSTRSDFIFVKNGEGGKDGEAPEIGSNGNWWIGGVDTGVVAAPDMAGYFNEDNLVALTNEEIDQLCVEEEA